jgi:electron transport complex protein RnfB
MPAVVRIDLSRCINCSLCRRACPTECIHYYSTGKRTHVVDPTECIGCDICIRVCPVDCIDEDATFVIEPEQLERAKAKARDWARRQRVIKADRKQRAVAASAATSGA